MAKSFNDKLIELLKSDPRFVDYEGELVKAAVVDWHEKYTLTGWALND